MKLIAKASCVAMLLWSCVSAHLIAQVQIATWEPLRNSKTTVFKIGERTIGIDDAGAKSLCDQLEGGDLWVVAHDAKMGSAFPGAKEDRDRFEALLNTHRVYLIERPKTPWSLLYVDHKHRPPLLDLDGVAVSEAELAKEIEALADRGGTLVKITIHDGKTSRERYRADWVKTLSRCKKDGSLTVKYFSVP